MRNKSEATSPHRLENFKFFKRYNSYGSKCESDALNDFVIEKKTEKI